MVLVDFNQKVEPEFRRTAKMQAVARGMTTREMVIAALLEFYRNNPVETTSQASEAAECEVCEPAERGADAFDGVDTLSISKQLRTAGFEVSQADAIAFTLYRLVAVPPATPQDLAPRLEGLRWQNKTVLVLLALNLALTGIALFARI